ncbi:MAG TPA: class I SAM-dependent methyltransferase [Chitinophagales bacterium]|nr:class I SAM-dependent methyltransferase [Chitinophagales bacterium]
MLKKIFRRHAYRGVFPYKKLADEFYDALSLACNGAALFIPENLYCLDYAIKNLPNDDPVIEIGSFMGMSTNMIGHFLKKYRRQNKLFSCDKWEFEEKEKKYYTRVLNTPPDEMKQFVRDSFLRNTKFFNGDQLPYTIEMFSDEFFDHWKKSSEMTDVFNRPVRSGGAVSFAYIDGNHQYEFVKRDFESVNEFLVKNGFIFFDDSAEHIDCGIRDFVKEVKRRKDYEVVMKNPNYLFRKIL